MSSSAVTPSLTSRRRTFWGIIAVLSCICIAFTAIYSDTIVIKQLSDRARSGIIGHFTSSPSKAMFSHVSSTLTIAPQLVVQYRILDGDNRTLSFEDMVTLFSDPSSQIHSYFDTILRQHFDGNTGAYFFECPVVTLSTIRRNFEFVLILSEALEKIEADCKAFETHLIEEENVDGVVSFLNIGGDASLVVPCPSPLPNHIQQTDSVTRIKMGDIRHYAHLAAFQRDAPLSQVKALWRKVFLELSRKLRIDYDEEEPKIWLSTSGLGVPWLHVRLDTTPKYYNWKPYLNTTKPI